MLEIFISLVLAGNYLYDINEDTKGEVQVKAHPPTLILSIHRRF